MARGRVAAPVLRLLPVRVAWPTPRFYSTPVAAPKRSARRVRLFLRLLLGVAVGIVVFKGAGPAIESAFPQTASSVERLAVVVNAMTKCIARYKTVLDKTFPTPEAYEAALNACHLECALITREAIETNGGIYIKLGQHLLALPHILPPEWVDTMVPLQDRCPRLLIPELDAMLQDELGQLISDMFSEFDLEPLGVALLAQVHRARLRESGQWVAVKFQHPLLHANIDVDVKMTKVVFAMLEKVFPDYPVAWLGKELQLLIYVEMDFRNEARYAARTRAYFDAFQKETALRVPEVYTANPRVLVMEYVPGTRLDDPEYLLAHGIAPTQVLRCLAHLFNSMIFTPDVPVHCDPHGGNLLIRAVDKHTRHNPHNPHNFEIVLYDHGLYRDVPLQMRRDYARFWLSLVDRDAASAEKYGRRFAGVSEEMFPWFAASITGRDFEHALSGDLMLPQTARETERMMKSLSQNGTLAKLMQLCSQLPPVVLLLLKTNDLVRHLDRALGSALGLERLFMVMASYCARTVYGEDLDHNSVCHRRWSPLWLGGYALAWLRYHLSLWRFAAADAAFAWR